MGYFAWASKEWLTILLAGEPDSKELLRSRCSLFFTVLWCSWNIQLLFLVLIRFFFQLHLVWAELGGLACGFGFEGSFWVLRLTLSCVLSVTNGKWCSDSGKIIKATQIHFLIYLRIKYRCFYNFKEIASRRKMVMSVLRPYSVFTCLQWLFQPFAFTFTTELSVFSISTTENRVCPINFKKCCPIQFFSWNAWSIQIPLVFLL